MIRTKIGLYLTAQDAIEEQWAKLSGVVGPADMDWIGLEEVLRQALEDPRLSDMQRVYLCRQAIGAFTGRGVPMPLAPVK